MDISSSARKEVPQGPSRRWGGSGWSKIRTVALSHLVEEYLGFPGGSDGKESTCNVGDPGSIPGSGRSPGGGHGNPLQYSCLESPMDRGAWRAHRVTKSHSHSPQGHKESATTE